MRYHTCIYNGQSFVAMATKVKIFWNRFTITRITHMISLRLLSQLGDLCGNEFNGGSESCHGPSPVTVATKMWENRNKIDHNLCSVANR